MFILVIVLLNLSPVASWRVKATVRDQLQPFDGGVHATEGFFGRWGAVLAELWRGPDREQQLLAELAEAREALWRLQAVEHENRELRAMMGFAVREGYRLVPCAVTARGDASGWWETVRLNRGTRAGIGPGMAVLTHMGLVGRTTAVSADTCEVLLISDPLARVACRVEPSGALGILKGMGVAWSGRDELKMISEPHPGQLEYIEGEAAIGEGDRVVTSGLGGMYPEGLLVGRVARVEKDRLGLYQVAEVTPAANLRRVRFAFVVTPDEVTP